MRFLLACLKFRESIGAAVTRRQCRIVRLEITRDAAAQEFQRAGAEPREAVQLELQVHRIGSGLGGRRQPLADHTQYPAAGIVLDADHPLQRLAAEDRVVPAAEQRPVVGDRPLPREIELNGLARIGTSPLEMLRRSVPGYQKTNDPTVSPRDRSDFFQEY